ncbi:hypothetical protein [Marinobacter sp. KMM 10035]|uniref:hypothetical protein n=1 Tax=Marinobacter sp. KMM 10035 TaxID=3134034 RepID=UPI00397A9AA0
MKKLLLFLLIVTTNIQADEMPVPSYMAKSYPYTYEVTEDGDLDLDSLCSAAPKNERVLCRANAKEDFKKVCEELTRIKPFQKNHGRRVVLESQRFFCFAYRDIKIIDDKRDFLKRDN